MQLIKNESILTPLFHDGRFLIVFTGLVLIFSGLFAVVQSFTGHFLPHDTFFLGMDAQRLSSYYSGRIVNFMFHDRVAFGGSIIAVGMIYMWLAEFPLRNGQAWAWWVLLISGLIGFGSFLTYLGYGYLDQWHGVATILLLPFFILGMIRSRILIRNETGIKDLFIYKNKGGFSGATALGFLLLQFTGAGIFLGGSSIMYIGITDVFVPQDLNYMGIVSCGKISELNENLVPLIAHDRACFGGGLATIGLIVFFTVRRAEELKSMWETLFLALNIGFLSAIGIHFYISYLDISHLAPAIIGYLIALVGLGLTRRHCFRERNQEFGIGS